MKKMLKMLFSLIFIGGGVNHFVNPTFYVQMMPAYIPAHKTMVVVSGVMEIILGIALHVQNISRYAAWGLVALLFAVFPANINMAVNAASFPDIPEWGLWLRLPLQGVLVWWACLYTRP